MQEDHNPYEAPRVPLSSPSEFAASLSEDELAIFSDETSEDRVRYYVGRLQKSLDGGSLGFNGAGLIRVPFGLWANRFYLRMAAKEVAMARARTGNTAEVASFLARRGGTSSLGLMAGLAISVVLRFLGEFGA